MMKKAIQILAVFIAFFLVPPAYAEVIGFDETPLPVGYSPLGSSFTDSGFEFSGSEFDRLLYDCSFSGCNAGIGFFDFFFKVQRVDGGVFSLNSIFIAGGVNYDGATPEYTPGTVTISGTTSDGSVLGFNQYLAAPGTLNVDFQKLVSFSLTYSPIVGSTRPLFDTLNVSPNAVPEPTTWTMFIASLGLIGAAVRRRRAVLPRLLSPVG